MVPLAVAGHAAGDRADAEMKLNGYRYSIRTRMAHCTTCETVYIFEADQLPDARVKGRIWTTHHGGPLKCPKGHMPLHKTVWRNPAPMLPLLGGGYGGD